MCLVDEPLRPDLRLYKQSTDDGRGRPEVDWLPRRASFYVTNSLSARKDSAANRRIIFLTVSG